MRMRLGRFARAAFAMLGLLVGSPMPAAAQDLAISFGSSAYEEDHEFCLMSGAAVTHYQTDASWDSFGLSASFVNSDVPWLIPPGSGGGAEVVFPASALVSTGQQQGPVFISQGELITASLEVFPLSALSGDGGGGLARVDRFLRPFVGAGVAVLTGGDPEPAGGNRNAPTYAIEGFTAPLLTYGARLHFPSREQPISLLLQYRQNHLFVGDFDFETPSGTTVPGDGETLTWGTWSIGASFRIGG